VEYVQPIRDTKQIDNMKRYLKEKNLRDWVMFILGINSGLRISDILKLTVEDVKDKDRIIIREIKTGKTKDFPIADSCKKALSEYFKSESAPITGILFPSRKSDKATKEPKAISRQQAYDVINEAARAVGITDSVGTHTLRKTFGYHAYKSGAGIEVIQKLLNHSAPSITLRYLGITQDDLDSVYINLNL